MERKIEVVKAMNTIMRSMNDESITMSWLACGVADGDDDYEWYAEEMYEDLCGLFARLMKVATEKRTDKVIC